MMLESGSPVKANAGPEQGQNLHRPGSYITLTDSGLESRLATMISSSSVRPFMMPPTDVRDPARQFAIVRGRSDCLTD